MQRACVRKLAFNDTSTANENHDALLAFTARHPSPRIGRSISAVKACGDISHLGEVIMKKGGMNLQGMAGNGAGWNLYCGFEGASRVRFLLDMV